MDNDVNENINSEQPAKKAGRIGQWATYVIMLAIGICLIAVYEQEGMMEIIIKLCGVALILPAVYSIFVLLFSGDKPSPLKSFAWGVCAAAAVGLGVVLIVVTDLFVTTLGIILSGLLIVGGVYQLTRLLLNHYKARIGKWMYIVPALMIVAGAVTMFTSLRENYPVLIVVAGTGLVLYSVNGMIALLKFRAAERRAAEAATDGVDDELNGDVNTESPAVD